MGDGDPPYSLKALYLRCFFELLVPKAIQATSGHNRHICMDALFLGGHPQVLIAIVNVELQHGHGERAGLFSGGAQGPSPATETALKPLRRIGPAWQGAQRSPEHA